ncbi:MAG: oxidoreductase [Mycobacteriales bacterium]
MTSWSAADVPDQTGRVALITGANSGLGLHTSLAVARRGARVLMACRDPRRGAEALTRVRAVGDAELIQLDLASLASVRAVAEGVTGPLDLLVDNAGVMAVPRRVTEDGFELQLGTNHLGHFALTGLLLPRLLAAPAGRVVVVSSDAHRMGRMRFDDLMGERSYGRWSAYGQSKLANLLFVRELVRRAPSLVVAAAHPGYAATNLQSGQGNPLLVGLMQVGNRVIAQPDAHGAWPQLYAATMPDVRTGEFFGPRWGIRGTPVRATPAKQARDDGAARRLWAESERLTGVTYP